MQIGRNELCPCGSGKKYKRCCIGIAEQQHSEVMDELTHIMACHPEITVDELNIVAQHRMMELNNRPMEHFFGLTPTQMTNWLYAPLDALTGVLVNTPDDVSASPVMRCLEIIIEEAMAQGGSFKATAKGNLPTKLVAKASALRLNLLINKPSTNISISEYAGSNEDKFNALHYSRVLAQLAGIIYLRSGRFHVKKEAQKRFNQKGLQAFFLPMLEAAVKDYNWGYFDGWPDDINVRTFWLFMLWRIKQHGSENKLIEEFKIAFPDFVLEMQDKSHYLTPEEHLATIIASRFVRRFLEFWGFAVQASDRLFNSPGDSDKVNVLPLFDQVFQFDFDE